MLEPRMEETPKSGADNPVAAENRRTGAEGVRSRSAWDVPQSHRDDRLVGFASPFSVDGSVPGARVDLKVKADHPFSVTIFRLGYYGGHGARIVERLGGGAVFPVSRGLQPACRWDGPQQTVDCSNWATSAVFSIDQSVPSGVYMARLVSMAGPNRGRGQLVPFVVRDDSRRSDILVQLPDITWQAYNLWTDDPEHTAIRPERRATGAFYTPGPCGGVTTRASYQRPFTSSARALPDGRPYDSTSGLNLFYSSVYTVIRWLERIGANVSYTTGQAVAEDYRSTRTTPWRSRLLPADAGAQRLFMTVGHDEYWSQEQRNNVHRARAAGVHLAFLAGNDMYWKVRFDGADMVVCEKHSNKVPRVGSRQHEFTGLWRDDRCEPSDDPADATGPENATTGSMSAAFGRSREILISPGQGRLRFWRGTGLERGTREFDVHAMRHATVGHEWNHDHDNACRPPGTIQLSSTPMNGTSLEAGTGDGARGREVSTHHLTLYRDQASGALVFHAGSIEFGRALDGSRGDPAATVPEDRLTQAVQRALVNLFADMGLACPAALPDPSWWDPPEEPPAPPVIAMEHPGRVMQGASVTVRGTATAAPGARVAAVEVSFRSGRWHPAVGREQWRYAWTPPGVGTYLLRCRAVDDWGSLSEVATATVAVEELVCLWDDRHQPPRYVIPDDHRHVWVGTEFIVEVPGKIVAARLRRPVDGPCMLTLVDVQNGRRLSSARAMPAGSSAGWETLRFEGPVTVQAARPYALLYRTTYGQGFAFHPGYFREPLRSGPVRAIAGHRSDLPLATVGTRDSGSYGVDVVFAPNGFYASKDRPRVIWPQAMSGKLDATRQEVEVGAHFTSSTEGYVDGIAFYRGVGSQGPCYVNLWLVLGESATRLASATVPSAEPSRWVHVRFRTPVRLIAGHQYVAALHTESGFAYSRLRPTVAPPLAFLFGAVLRFDRDAHGFALSTASDGSPTGSDCSVPTFGRGIAPLAATDIHPLVTPMFRPTAGARHTLWPEGGVEPMQARQFLAVGIEVGLEFSCEVEGSVEAVRFLNEDDQRYTVSIWDRSGALLGRATGGPDAHEGDGWREIALDPPCRMRPRERYTASYASPSGQCAFTADYFAADPDDPVRTLCLRGHGGVYGPMNRRPTRRQIRRFPGGPLRANYFVDVVFRTAR